MNTADKIAEIAAACDLHGERAIVVLSGVAATGKTFLGLAAAHRHSGHPYFVKQIQFHQSYTYEDFIEGLHPTVDGGFKPREGVFLEWNNHALRDPANRYVLLIEEFTRANISAVLGELMTFIEYRNRFFETPLTRRRVRVAPNLTLVATMNPQDRSALEIDDALIRRLRIVECPPSVEQLREMMSGADPGIADGLAKLFETCRDRHPDTFADAMPFGHGVFAGIRTSQQLTGLWQQQLRYLLRRNPQVAPHPFAKDIEELYPWTTAGGTAPQAP